MRLVSFALVLASVAACATDEEEPYGPDHLPPTRVVQLAELPLRSLESSISVSLNAPTAHRTVGSRISLVDGPVISEGKTVFCPVLADDVQLVIAGVAARVTERGKWRIGAMLNPQCDPPSFAAEFPADVHPENPTAVLSDGTQTIEMQLGDVFVDRAATPVGHADWTFAPGEVVDFQWPTAADLTATFGGIHYFDGVTDHESSANIEIIGDRVRFAIPDLAPGTGTIALDLFVGRMCGEQCGELFEAATIHTVTIEAP